jgi:hypothetical protein
MGEYSASEDKSNRDSGRAEQVGIEDVLSLCRGGGCSPWSGNSCKYLVS